MSTADGKLFVTPQAYPLWVAWFEPTRMERESREDLDVVAGMTDDELNTSVRENSPPYLVIAWEYIPGHVPEPVVPEIGQGSGRPFFGASADEVCEQVRHAARRDRDLVRDFLKQNPQKL
ncbi:hypothetical protein [Micromonospora luteifusca]|uniref:hypothetical protein n=1 Tax=Micromonospora luteifusca TaxID=709860 RepID=UPI0033B447C0